MSKQLDYIDLYGQETYLSKVINNKTDTTIVECVIVGQYEDRGSIRKGQSKLDKFYVEGFIENTPIHDVDHNMISTGGEWKNIRVEKNYETVEGKILDKALIGDLHVKDTDTMPYKDNNGVIQDRGSLRKAILEGKLPFVSVYARPIDMLESDNIRHIYTFDVVAISSISQPAGQQFSSTKIIQKNMTINDEIKKCLCNAYIPELKMDYYIDVVKGGIYTVLEATETKATIKNVVTLEEMNVISTDSIWEQLIGAVTDQVDEYLMNLVTDDETLTVEEEIIKAIEDVYVKTFLKACQTCKMARQNLGQSKLDKNKEPKNSKLDLKFKLKKDIDSEADSQGDATINVDEKIDTTEDKIDINQEVKLETRIENLETSIENLVNLVTEKVTNDNVLKEEIEKMQQELVLSKSWNKPKTSLKLDEGTKEVKMNLPYKITM